MNFQISNGLKALSILLILSVLIVSCSADDEQTPVPQNTIEFKSFLSEYNIFEGSMSELKPTDSFHEFELRSALFTDYAKKQRLINIPKGFQMEMVGDDLPIFPDSTILVKTFYYNNDDRFPEKGNRIIETRILIKVEGIWNTATYVWNSSQTEATLNHTGQDLFVEWITLSGNKRSTTYHIPNQRECAICHQKDFKLSPIGPKMRNLNRDITHNNLEINQLEHFNNLGLIENLQSNTIGSLPAYSNQNESLANRARAYLEVNCAHCHNPYGFEDAASENMDLRFTTSLSQSGMIQNRNDIIEVIESGEMPFIGTTLPDDNGIELIVEYINSL